MKKILIICFLTLLFTPTVIANNGTAETPFKEPVSKQQIIFKFLYAMGGVAVSSIILFVGLSAYNKVRNKLIKIPTNDYANTFNSPNNLKDAVNIYLEKTKD